MADNFFLNMRISIGEGSVGASTLKDEHGIWGRGVPLSPAAARIFSYDANTNSEVLFRQDRFGIAATPATNRCPFKFFL